MTRGHVLGGWPLRLPQQRQLLLNHYDPFAHLLNHVD
jgi:hypothetical protein